MNKEKLNILWAEDDRTLRELMCELLESEGHNCFPAYNGLAARDILLKEKIDLIITDFQMPVMNGAGLLMWCRENNFHQPVIFVSANIERLPIETLVMGDCCTSLIQKPFAIERLLEEIENSRKRNHEFECTGRTVSKDKVDFKTSFPGQHYIESGS